VIELADGSHVDRELRDATSTLDAIVIGSGTSDPIQTVQRAYRLDPMVSVVVLGSFAQCDLIRGALRFTPFIGSDVECDVVDRTADGLTRIMRAAERTRARRTHRRRLESLNSELARRGSSKPGQPMRERLLSYLVDTAPIGIVALDPRRRVLSLNYEAARLLRQTEREALGHVLAPRTLEHRTG
jgi:PAS domain-containing protein